MNIEKLKNDAIEKSYGGFYFKCKPNENGWSKELNDFLHHLGETDDVEWLNYTITDFWRPKSLAGIENNRGWIIIEEDGSNLPKEKCVCFFFNKRSAIESFTFGQQAYFGQLTESEYILKYFTHYQPIIKPLNPIY